MPSVSIRNSLPLERIIFTNNTTGKEGFDRIFLHGNAVVNYYFFVSSDYRGEMRKRQEAILKKVGKFLKRTTLVSEGKDTELMEDLVNELDEHASSIFLFRLVNRHNQDYYMAFHGFYSRDKLMRADEKRLLANIASRYKIDNYQQERMKIDVMYRHPENKRIVDEYKDILVASSLRDVLHPSELARLGRLRTLSLRENIPSILFDTLDELLLKGKKLLEIEEPEYLKETRAILENLFFKDPALKRHIIEEDIIKLLKARHRAQSQSDMGFEQILLDAGRLCDEIARETNNLELLEDFGAIITYFDRYDNIRSLMGQLAFAEDIRFSEDTLRSIIGNKKAFDALSPVLFEELFVKDIFENRYLTRYGKKKVSALLKGLKRIEDGNATYNQVVKTIGAITNEERLYHYLHRALKEKMRSFFPGLDLKEGREEIRREIERELKEKGIRAEVLKGLFERVLLDLKKESFYINHLLPIIIEGKDVRLREDFLENSGLDRFYIETLEREYLNTKGLRQDYIEEIGRIRNHDIYQPL